MKKLYFAFILSIMSIGILSSCVIDKDIKNIDEQAVLDHCRRIDEAQDFFNEFMYLADDESAELPITQNPYPGTNYYTVARFESISRLKEYILGLYSSQVAEEYYFKYFEDPKCFVNGSPFFIEVNGKLFCDKNRYAGKGGRDIYDFDTLKIQEIDDDSAVVSVNYCFAMDSENVKTKTISLIKENNRWVFNNFI